jgi:hypothetical protein
MMQAFDPGDRTYDLSDERLAAFQALTPAERLRWVEELATFLRLARAARTSAMEQPPGDIQDFTRPR